VLLGLFADVGLFLNGGAQDVARGVVGQAEVVDQPLGLRAFAGSRGAQEDEILFYFRNPS
jgi:hypothetical protein